MVDKIKTIIGVINLKSQPSFVAFFGSLQVEKMCIICVFLYFLYLIDLFYFSLARSITMELTKQRKWLNLPKSPSS